MRNKAEVIVDNIVEHDFDRICITETWLSGNDAASIAAITPMATTSVIFRDEIDEAGESAYCLKQHSIYAR